MFLRPSVAQVFSAQADPFRQRTDSSFGEPLADNLWIPQDTILCHHKKEEAEANWAIPCNVCRPRGLSSILADLPNLPNLPHLPHVPNFQFASPFVLAFA